jgi:hypothetical protein
MGMLMISKQHKKIMDLNGKEVEHQGKVLFAGFSEHTAFKASLQ